MGEGGESCQPFKASKLCGCQGGSRGARAEAVHFACLCSPVMASAGILARQPVKAHFLPQKSQALNGFIPT